MSKNGYLISYTKSSHVFFSYDPDDSDMPWLIFDAQHSPIDYIHNIMHRFSTYEETQAAIDRMRLHDYAFHMHPDDMEIITYDDFLSLVALQDL